MNFDKSEQEKKGRIRSRVEDISYDETLCFFNKRAEKYKETNPYAVTMYQDHNSKLVRERNDKEKEIILPFLAVDMTSKVLDIACGIGRWLDAIDEDIKEYCGVDFSEDLIRIARTRHKDCKKNVDFLIGSATELECVLAQNKKGKYNRILMMGILIYLNDSDIRNVFRQVAGISEKDTILCLREPVSIENRLTLKDFYSEELDDNYNAIYRTRDELMSIFNDTLAPAGFCVEREGWLFEDSLNNRKETAQYYFVFRRNIKSE